VESGRSVERSWRAGEDTDHWSADELSPKGERRLRGLLFAEFQRKFHPTSARGPVSRVDQLEYRPAVRTGLLRRRRVEDAADAVIHLLRNAGVPQLVEDGERPPAGIGCLLDGIS